MNDTDSIDGLAGPCERLDLRVSVPDAYDEDLVALAKAIAHPIRVQILRLLARQSTCVCGEIVEALPLAQSTVSEHLRILKEAGLIKGEVDGPRVCYALEPEGVARLKQLIEQLS